MLHLLLFTAIALSTASEGFVPLFDGKTLDGWVNPYDSGKVWVENGEIRILSEKPIFLMTKRRFGDFVLEAELLVPDGGNSGIQFRSQMEPGNVWGYQAEVDTSDRRWSGGLYDQGRRMWLAPLDGKPAAKAAYKNNEWNKFRIECIADHIRIWVNGIPTADYVDSIDIEGHIGLQDHGKFRLPKAEIYRYRGIRIKDLGRRKWMPLGEGQWHASGTWLSEAGTLTGKGKGASRISNTRCSDCTVRLKFKVDEGRARVTLGELWIPLDPQGAAGLARVGRSELIANQPSISAKPAVRLEDGWHLLSISVHRERIVVHQDGLLLADLEKAPINASGKFALMTDPNSGGRVEFRQIEKLSEPAR